MHKLERTAPAYPGCPNAIRLFELSFGHPKLIEKTRLEFLARTVDQLIMLMEVPPSDRIVLSAEEKEILRAGVAEVDTPDFRRYLLARIWGSV